LEKNPPKDILGKKITETNTADGIKFMCEDSSWLFFRLSGTEPILRIYAEAAKSETAQEILKFGKKFISEIK